MKYSYKISSEIKDLSIKDIELFLYAFKCKFENNEPTDEIIILDPSEHFYNFYEKDAISIFKTTVKLHWLWGLCLFVDEYDSQYNLWKFTNIKIPYEVNKRNYSEYLYNNLDLLDNIEIGSSVRIWIAICPQEFYNCFMQVIYNQIDIAILPNKKLLSNCIKYIKSHIGGESILWKEVTIKYDFDDYIEGESSVFPMLVELEKLKAIKFKNVSIVETDLCFTLQIKELLDETIVDNVLNIIGWSDIDTYIEQTDNIKQSLNGIKITEEIIYNNQSWIISNTTNWVELEILSHQQVFLNMLLEWRWTRFSYEKIMNQVNERWIISPIWTYKWNLLKSLRHHNILWKKEDFIDGKNWWYMIK